MWRSVARSSLSTSMKRLLSSPPNPEVFGSKTLIILQSHSPLHFSTSALYPKTLLLQNPRFFSNHPYVEDPLEISPSSGADDTQMDGSVSAARVLDLSSPDSDENGDTHKGNLAPEGEEVGVYEIDVEKLESVRSLLQSSVDGSLGSSLDHLGVALHEDFVVKVLETPVVLGENLIEFYRWASSKEEIKVNPSVVNGLVSAICGSLRVRDAYAVWDLIKEIGEKEVQVLSTETLNKLIAAFSQFGKGKVAFEVFNKFEEFGCVRDADTYYFTIEALSKRSIFDWASSVCETMLNEGVLPDSVKVGKIISWLCKGKKVKDAYLVYMLAKEQNKYPPQSSVNFLIGSLCCEDEHVKSALEILDDFTGDTRKYAVKPFSAAVSGLCRINDMDGARKLLVKMIAEGPPPGNAVFNSLTSGYSKAGDMGKAEEIMRMMKSRGLKPDVYTYTVVISGYAKGGQMEEARKVLSEAKKKHSKLSPVTYHTLIRGYCKLEEFGNALKLLGEMKKFGVHPNVDEYTKLIRSLCLKSLDWKTAEKLMKEMEEKGLFLNGITKGLVRAVKDLEEESIKAKEVAAEA